MQRLVLILTILSLSHAEARSLKSRPYLVQVPLTLNPVVELEEVENFEPDVPMGTKLFVKPAHRQALLKQTNVLRNESERLKAAFNLYLQARLESSSTPCRMKRLSRISNGNSTCWSPGRKRIN